MIRARVAGAGAIGSLFAGHLVRVTDVAALSRRADARALRRGLRVSRKRSPLRVTASEDPRALNPAERSPARPRSWTRWSAPRWLLSGGHSHDCAETAGRRGDCASPGSWPIISRVTFLSGVRHDDAHVEYELDTATSLGPYAGTATSYGTVAALHELLTASGLRSELFADLLLAQWSKLIFNSAINGIAALARLPHAASYDNEGRIDDLGRFVRAVVEEGLLVATAAGVELRESDDASPSAIDKGPDGIVLTAGAPLARRLRELESLRTDNQRLHEQNASLKQELAIAYDRVRATA